jgi:hypothetical protein
MRFFSATVIIVELRSRHRSGMSSR